MSTCRLSVGHLLLQVVGALPFLRTTVSRSVTLEAAQVEPVGVQAGGHEQDPGQHEDHHGSRAASGAGTRQRLELDRVFNGAPAFAGTER